MKVWTLWRQIVAFSFFVFVFLFAHPYHAFCSLPSTSYFELPQHKQMEKMSNKGNLFMHTLNIPMYELTTCKHSRSKTCSSNQRYRSCATLYVLTLLRASFGEDCELLVTRSGCT